MDGCMEARAAITISEIPCPQCGEGMELFIKDGIHLNHEGQLLWRDGYIRPAIEALINEYGLEELRK